MAAEYGHLHVLVWARENGCEWGGTDTCAGAAFGGHLHVLQWLREKGCPWNYDVLEVAETGGHKEVAAWAKENGCPDIFDFFDSDKDLLDPFFDY